MDEEAGIDQFRSQLTSYTLSELEDVYSQLDRITHPERLGAIRSELDQRILALGTTSPDATVEDRPAGGFRRIWGNIVDVFVSLLPLGFCALVFWLVAFILSQFGVEILTATSSGRPSGRGGGFRGRGGGRGGAPEPDILEQAVELLTDPDAVWKFVLKYGPWFLAFVTYRALFVVPQWANRGTTPGMREAGVALRRVDGGRLSRSKALIRILSAYVLFPATLGLSGLWMFFDRRKQALHDKITDTWAVRSPRPWEKPDQARLAEH